jgi:outer membrane protein OmpA-like peptidoglycan-associated protein
VTGPNSATTSTATITRDTVAPTISSFSSTTGDGSYKAGSTINITATAGETVQSGNTITVTLDTGATVVLTAASASASLTGTYTVAAGQTSADLTVSSFTIGTVADTAGNAMTSTTVPSGANNIAGAKAIVIDTTAPTATLGVPDLAGASDTGVSATDDITSDDTPTLSVGVTNLEAGGTGYVKASKTGSSDVTCTLTAGSCTLGALAQGAWSIVSYQNDAAGNDGSTSAVSAALSITVFTSAPTTATLATSAAISSVATITFTVTGSHQLDCTSLSTTAAEDFTLTGISAISSIVQTSTTVCTVTATSTATAGGGAVVSTLTAAASFSVSDPAGNARTTLTGSPQSITVTVPSTGPGERSSDDQCAKVNHAFDDCPLWPGRTTTTTVAPASGGGGPRTTAPPTTSTTSTTIAPRPPTTIPPAVARAALPGVPASRTVVVLTPAARTDAAEVVGDLVRRLSAENKQSIATRVRDAIVAAAPSIGEAIAEAVTRLAAVLEDATSTHLEIVRAKAAVADASAKSILVALEATNGNTRSLALPITTTGGQLPDVDPGKSLVLTPTGVLPAELKVVANSTVVLTSRGGNLSMSMTAVNGDGSAAPVNDDDAVVVAPGQSLAVTGTGFVPRSEVVVWMFSEPRQLGTVTTDANGSFAAAVPMTDNLAPGDHTAQVNGVSKAGGVRSLNLGLEVALDAPTGAPPATSAKQVTVNFRGDSSRLYWKTITQLRAALPQLRKAGVVEVVGYAHRDSNAAPARARELSRRRAANVRWWLERMGVRVGAVRAVGSTDLASRDDPRRNRRVVITWGG